MADKIPELLIDEILASAKAYTGVQEQPRYSAERIDRLISEISGEDTEPQEQKAGRAAEPESVQAPKPQETVHDEIGGFKLNKTEKKKFTVNIPEFDKTVKDDVSVLLEDGGQMGLASGGVHIGGETNEEEDAQPEKDEQVSVDGQISIEKTRLFNEVKIRGEYNPNISHNLGNKVARTTTGEAEPLATPVMGEEKYRKHFMNRPVQNLEKTQEHRRLLESLPQKTIETPGVIVKKSAAGENTDGIQPLPTIVPAEYELEQEKTRLDIPRINDDTVAENQIVFDGFKDDEPVRQQSEEQAEAELRIARKDAVSEFVNGDLLFKQEVEERAPKKRYDRQSVNVAREYFGPKDKPVVLKILQSEKKRLAAKTAALSVLCVLMSLLSAAAGMDNGNFELYNNNEIIYIGVQLVLLLIASFISFGSFAGAFRCIKRKTADMNTVVAVSVLAAAAQCIAASFFTDTVETSAHLLTGAALIPMILKNAGELVRCKNDIDNFAFVSDEEKVFYTVENIGDENTANEIARGLMLGDPDIKYSAPADFPSRFVELSRSAEPSGKLLKTAVPLVFTAAVIIAAVYGAMTKSVFGALSVFAGAVLIGLPVSAGLSSAVNLRSADSSLREDGAVINGYGAVEDAVNSNGVIIDAYDAFADGGCNIEGIKLYHKMRIDEAILYTASVIIESGGALSAVFDGIIIGKRELLFPVETLAYEERLGCSCWIHNHRVLVGSRELLVHHNVETPDRELEEKYKAEGRSVVYLAIEGKIAAMFVVSYKADKTTAKYLRKLEKDGLTIFFRTADANINEEFIEKEFGLPQNVVKIINPVAGDMFLKVKNTVLERSDAKIVHDGSMKSMLKALHSAFAVNSYVNVSRVIQLVSSAVGAAIVALLAFMSGLAQVGVWQIIIYQAVWALLVSLLPVFRKK